MSFDRTGTDDFDFASKMKEFQGSKRGAKRDPGHRILGASDDNSDTYELYELWRDVQRIRHVPSGREGTWAYQADADNSSAFYKDGPLATIQWADGEVETLVTQNEKQYFSSKPSKAYETISMCGPAYDE